MQRISNLKHISITYRNIFSRVSVKALWKTHPSQSRETHIMTLLHKLVPPSRVSSVAIHNEAYMLRYWPSRHDTEENKLCLLHKLAFEPSQTSE